MRLVGNILEIKGRGVLLLGLQGKSTTSIALPIKHEDAYLVADDYCNLFFNRTRVLIKEVTYHTTQVDTHAIREEYVSYQVHPRIEVLGTSDFKQPTGLVRNVLMHQGEKDLHEWLGISGQSRMDKLRLQTRYIDTMAQRIAHKSCVRIDYVVFFGSSLKESHFMEMIDDLRIDIRSKEGREAAKYLRDVFFTQETQEHVSHTQELPRKTLIPRKNSYYIESDSKKQALLVSFLRRWDSRGDDWSKLFTNREHETFDAPRLTLILFHEYENIIHKIQDLYSIIVPKENLPDNRETSIKFYEQLDDLGIEF